MFGLVTVAFLDYFCLFREGKFNKCRVGWLHSEIMHAACKVKKSQMERPLVAAQIPCIQGKAFFFFIADKAPGG